ncbi:hypothetical protein IAQ61_006573 [Plenodomus lingam]|uniref:uncharacterized protein n=1 Tax=Leptosphaeria maculans TaxID=5022 RepID=UPI003326E296|nr:hypothetical protein IAQ61_006573 [Plenodomus lingam]
MSDQQAPITNGETPSSRVLSHLHSYPVVHDSVEGFKQDPRGSRVLALATNTYKSVVAPFTPYLATPYSYLHPYLDRADQIGDNTLSKIETNFPIVKEDTSKVKEVALSPYTYVAGTWQDEYKKTARKDGPVKTGIVLISTELKIVQDACQVFLDYWYKTGHAVSKKAEEEEEDKEEDGGRVGEHNLLLYSSSDRSSTEDQSIDGDANGRRDSITKIVDAIFSLPGIVLFLQQKAEEEVRREVENGLDSPPRIIYEPDRTLHFVGFTNPSVIHH